MPIAYVITFLPEGKVEDFYGCHGPSYELEDGSYLDVRTKPIWCHCCGKITHGERLTPLQEIDEELKNLANPDSDYVRNNARMFLDNNTGKGNAFLRDTMNLSKRRREWRASRMSPAKCIDCGSTEIYFFPIGQTVPHPAGQGTIRIDIDGFADTTRDDAGVLTPEGDRIARRMKSPDADVLRRVREFDRRFYVALGNEDTAKTCGHEGCTRGVVRLSVFCKRHHFESVMEKACPFED